MSEQKEPEPKEEKACFDFLGAFHICKGDMVRVKVARETFIGEVEEVRDWGIVIRDQFDRPIVCLLYTSPSPRDGLLSRMPSSA